MVAANSSKVLLDMSPLDTPSRLRGVGQYVIGLAMGLQELQEQGKLGFTVDGLACYDEDGRPTGTDSLSYRGSLVHPDRFDRDSYVRRKLNGLARAAQLRGAHLLHVTEPEPLVRDVKVPLVLTCYDLIPLVLHKQYLGRAPWKRPLRHRKDAAYYRKARRIITISESTKRDLIQYLDINEDIIDVTYPGVDHIRYQVGSRTDDERARIMAKYGLSRPFILYLGAFDPRKNVQLLVRAFVDAKLTKDFDLVLAGAMHYKDKAKLTKLVDSLGLSSVTRMIGFVDDADVAAIYRACHVHVFPSEYEGFGLPVAEAMACGAPTITTTATSLPEVAGDGACLVPANDEEALAVELKTLSIDDGRRARLRVQGPKASARFCWRECARQTARCYGNALLAG
jgi:glycosyltransferase involved in cell wall biosynthesis